MGLHDDLIDNVVVSGYCTGCGICAGMHGSRRIEMRLSEQGNIRPSVVHGSEQYNPDRLRQVCPGIYLAHESATHRKHPIWGPIEAVRTGHAVDEEVRRLGSSGGVVSAIALYLIESGRVDFVVQIAASSQNPLSNEVQMSRTRDDVLLAAGSRYAPAAPLARMEEFLASGQRFAIVGKPCDVAAVRNLARVDARVADQVPYLLSFMCAGVPSLAGTEAVLSKLDVSADEITSFRYRGDGWPGKLKAVTRDGRVAEMDYATSWGTILNRYLQFRCKICPDGTGEFADVVCADAWYGKDGYPDFQEHEGRSLVISRTRVGEDLVSAAVRAGAITTVDLAATEIAAMQPYQVDRKKLVFARMVGAWLRHGWVPRFRRLGLLRASFHVNPVAWLRQCWGTFKRANGEIA